MILSLLLFVTILVILALYFCNRAIDKAAIGKLYDDTNAIPFNRVGLLLGTSKYLSKSYPNPYYDYRIEAAVRLLRANKIRYIIVSGDNRSNNYNEPKQMQTDLVKAGIDSSAIFLDYAGFRTFDSMVRLKEIFGQDTVTVISQSFHNERAIYIAYREGISAIGFNAADVSKSFGFRVLLREKLARVKVFLDYIIGTKPKFLGQKVTIPA